MAVFDLLQGSFLEYVAPVTARDDELEGFQFRMNTFCPVKQISVQRILCVKKDTGETVSVLPLYALQPLLKFRFCSRHDVSRLNLHTTRDIKIDTNNQWPYVVTNGRESTYYHVSDYFYNEHDSHGATRANSIWRADSDRSSDARKEAGAGPPSPISRC